ncbi:RagB/SusD family nutrient uptake outer membrane protein [Sinomicrobium soli]|uniref:RagB/SusD family nutrient uptake outer membrane protein n=1 Tax=Sinomicrobium sp. N-1-3-6 TaxID=2219864 RepID=UPI000DCD42DB|nr:RagB/SusD family nutrient uptake outer membrane protein [Sinomicrobium sp. N-1-3-6]RAV27716.1 RagB/SusD family nutrient uptake outer membrane protein [Sinomicrobium sp. N-1-3-6]
MKRYIYIPVLAYSFFLCSCEDFVEIDTPNFEMVSTDIFANEETARVAIKGIYNQLRPSFFIGGISVYAGFSGNLIRPRISHEIYDAFWQHELSATNSPDATTNLNIWSSAYNIIYLCNSLMEGINNSENLSEKFKDSLRGQAMFIRAFTYFYLVNIYGDVPLLLTTNYKINALASIDNQEIVWDQIETDLLESMNLLKNETAYPEEERFYVTHHAVLALLSRVYLYRQLWDKAEEYSSMLIEQTTDFEILDDLDQVFMAHNREAIWQIDPMGGYATNIVTAEGKAFAILVLTFPGFTHVQGIALLADHFILNFEHDDQRLEKWIGAYEQGGEEYNYIYKYKENLSSVNNKEATVVLRLAEQYLIRAEARTHLKKIDLAISDLDVIRSRANINLLSAYPGELNQEELLDSIMLERKREFFGEFGHRWFDLKRIGAIEEEFSNSPTWQAIDAWYPIPDEERQKNPNLGQNQGY